MSAIKPTPYQVQVKIFEQAGCEYVRTQGDHLIYQYPGAIDLLLFQNTQKFLFSLFGII